MRKILSKAFGFFKNNRNQDSGIIDKHGNSLNMDYRLFYFLMNEYGYNKKHQILSDSEYNNKDLIPVFRGYEQFEYGRNHIFDDSYHFGVGALYGDGIYFTSAMDEAYNYSFNREKCLNLTTNKVLEAKVDAENVITFNDIVMIKTYLMSKLNNKNIDNHSAIIANSKKINEILSFINSINDVNIQLEFGFSLLNNYSSIAILLGFDAILTERRGREYIVALDRRKVCVSESTASRFLSGAEAERVESAK